METEEEILQLLREQGPLTITEITEFLKYCQSTVSKYIAILDAKKEIKIRKVGKAKLISVRELNG